MRKLLVITNCLYLVLALRLNNENNSTYSNESKVELNSKLWLDTQYSPEQRAQAILKEMTYEEKVSMVTARIDQPEISGESKYVGMMMPIKRLGIPKIYENDGPAGFVTTNLSNHGTSTQYPSPMSLAATWNPDTVYLWSSLMAKEFKQKNSRILLAPGLNVNRNPENGRNFEYLTGEDPYLGYVLSQPAVHGIQDQKVMAVAKHFIGNEQETLRTIANSEIDEKTLNELYYPPFEGAIKAGVMAIMCSYNRINGAYACDNNKTLNGDLRGQLGFKGFVMSDWMATHTPDTSTGMDQEQGDKDPIFNSKTLAKHPEALDESVYKIMLSLFATGILDEKVKGSHSTNTTNNVIKDQVQEIASESIVLLKNDNNILPMDLSKKGLKLLVLAQGYSAFFAYTGGYGSSEVKPSSIKQPLEAVAERMGIDFSKFQNNTLLQTVCNDKTGSCLTYKNYGIDYDQDTLTFDMTMTAAEKKKHYNLASLATGSELVSYSNSIVNSQLYDTALILNQGYAKEGFDRNSTVLDYKALDKFVQGAYKDKKNIIFSAALPGGSILPIDKEVNDAILVNFYLGERMSDAILDVIEGKVNPSGKLPATLPNIANETKWSRQQYPGLNKETKEYETVSYSEKLLTGYRKYDAQNITPAFEFGRGLSYTQFTYDKALNIQADLENRTISLNVQNSGQREGKEVVQMYIGFPEKSEEPPKLLKGFKKINLKPGESQEVKFNIDQRDISTWDVNQHKWVVNDGNFQVFIGSSSRDIRSQGAFTVQPFTNMAHKIQKSLQK